MTAETTFIFALIAVAAVLMASNRVRFDIVAVLVVLALMLSGVLSVGEALAGFGSSVVILVAALLVVGEMLDRTGVARAVGDWILKKGGSNETRLLIVIIAAGMLPLADALQKTGGTDLIVDALLGAIGYSGPDLMLGVIFFLAGLGLVLSNTASAVLVAPIAIAAAQALDVSPYPFAVAVLIAASAAFSTPVSTPVVTLVVEPGRYKFLDFVKVGVPLLLLTYLTTALVAPLIFPFHPS